MKQQKQERQPLRVSITGIDGAGKDTIARNALQKLSEDGLRVMKLGRPAYLFVDGQQRQVYKRTTERIDAMHQAADVGRDARRIMAVNALNVVVQSRVLEKLAVQPKLGVDVLASSRDSRVDPTVYFDFYASNGLQSTVDMRRRLRAMQHLTGISRDLIVLLKVDPDVAVERIESRLADEQKLRIESGKEQAGMRDKWRHMHENVTDLGWLSERYDEALDLLQEVSPTPVVVIDTTELSADVVTNLTYQAIKSFGADTISKNVAQLQAPNSYTGLTIPA